jgi:hypothetical protein
VESGSRMEWPVILVGWITLTCLLKTRLLIPTHSTSDSLWAHQLTIWFASNGGNHSEGNLSALDGNC